MSAQSRITCSCGRQIEGREVLQQGYFMTAWRPVWVYVKYRCSRCRMLGERLVDYTQWTDDALSSEPAGPPAGLPIDLPSTGEIADAEIAAFADRLRSLRFADLDQLADSLA